MGMKIMKISCKIMRKIWNIGNWRLQNQEKRPEKKRIRIMVRTFLISLRRKKIVNPLNFSKSKETTRIRNQNQLIKVLWIGSIIDLLIKIIQDSKLQIETPGQIPPEIDLSIEQRLLKETKTEIFLLVTIKIIKIRMIMKTWIILTMKTQ